MNASSDQISVRRYLDPLRRFAPLVLIGTLVGAGLGFVGHALTGTTYTSTVSVLVSPISGDPVDGLGTSAVNVDMRTEAEVATSLVVAERVNDLLAGQPPAKDARDLLDQIETSVRGTRIIEMAFTAAEPEIAQRGAEAFAEAFLSYRNDLATSQLEISSNRLEARVFELQLELADVSTRRAEVPESERNGAADTTLEINERTLLDELSANQRRLADLRAVITDDAVVIDTASLPRSPSSLGLVTLVVGGAAAAFVLCAGVALMVDAARRRNEDDEVAEAVATRQVFDAAAAEVAQPPGAPPAPTGGPLVADAPMPQPDLPWDPTPEPTIAMVEPPAVETQAQAEAAAAEPALWQAPPAPGTADELDQPIDRWSLPQADAPAAADSPALPAPEPASWGDPTAGGESASAWGTHDRGDAAPTASREGLDAFPDPFASGGQDDDTWGDSDSAFDSGDGWSSTPAIAETAQPSAEDPWAAPLTGPDEDAWAGIVEAASGGPATDAIEPPTPWNDPAPTTEPPWAIAEPDPWAVTASAAGSAPTEVPGPVVAPIDLDHLLRERARESVAQLGDHLTQAVDIDRRSVMVVDGGDGAAVPVAVAMAAHLAATGRRILLVDPHGNGLVATPGRYEVRDRPTLEVLVGDMASDHVSFVGDVAGDDTMVVFAGAALDSPLVTADGDWPGAIVIATTGVANPASIPDAAFQRVMGSRHPLIGIVSIMARPAMTPPIH